MRGEPMNRSLSSSLTPASQKRSRGQELASSPNGFTRVRADRANRSVVRDVCRDKTARKPPLYLGRNPLRYDADPIHGQHITLEGEDFYQIANYDRMRPFFMS